jgi:sugar phosphate isomerase/epimerase
MMKRRHFIQTAGGGFAAAHLNPFIKATGTDSLFVRLGGPLFDPYGDPEEWARLLTLSGYRAAYCPVEPDADPVLISNYRDAAARHDIVISEVGAWSNTISPDPEEASESVKKCIAGLELADRIGAKCCVNISGSRNEKYWAGPHQENLSADVFDLVVENTKKIIDAVKPKQARFALEAMPWSFPDSTETYLQLLKAIDRPHFGVHIDPVNMIRSPREYFNNGALIREMFSKLGSKIVSCHAKDIILREDNYIPQMDEVRAGLGKLDYVVYLQELARLEDIPLMMEHLNTAEEYKLAAGYIRSVGRSVHISL